MSLIREAESRPVATPSSEPSAQVRRWGPLRARCTKVSAMVRSCAPSLMRHIPRTRSSHSHGGIGTDTRSASPLAIEAADSSFTGIDFAPKSFVEGPVERGAALYVLEGDFGFSPPNATAPAPEVGHEVKLINFDQKSDKPLALQIRGFARNNTGEQAFISNISGFNRPTNIRFGPNGCAYVVDYSAVRDNGPETHFVGAGNGPLVQIPGTGVIYKICPE